MLQLLTKKNRKGFTLIELLVVIAIIGILATIVLVSLNSARVRARDARRLSDMQQISLAMELYYDNNSSVYPESATSDNAGFLEAITDLKTDDLIGATPADPGSNVYDAILNTGNTGKYCLFVALEQNAGEHAVASHDGAGKRNAAPADLDNCGPNL